MKLAVALAVCVVLCGSSLAAPLSDAANSERAKRSNEVIFYENQQKGAKLNKRSESWPILSQHAAKQNKESELGTTAADEELALLTEEEIKAIEEKAFYEAVDFVVDRLVNEIYPDVEEEGEISLSDSDDDIAPPTIKAETTPVYDVKPDKDEEAYELALLNELAKASKPEKEIITRADNSEKIATRVKTDDSEMNMKEDDIPKHPDTVEKMDLIEKTTTVTPLDIADYENYGADYDYNISNLLDYMDYLNLLKTVERKLKANLQNTDKNVVGENDSSVKSRKKRSLESNLELWDKGAEDRQNGGDGSLCFSAEEVAELKALLVQLAKEKIESEDLISYLLGADNMDSLYNDYEPQARDYPVSGKNKLYKLAQQMDRPDKRYPPAAYNGWPYERL